MFVGMQGLDVLVVGAGHNALVCALELARAGRRVHVLEARSVLGGATRTEQPFVKAPDVKCSTGAYLVGLMPPELLQHLEIELPLLRRDPHYFLPTMGEGHLLFGSDRDATKAQMLSLFGEKDWAADQRLQAELDAFREDVGPTWLQAPLSVEETAERFVRAELRTAFVDLCTGSIGDYLARFGFESELLMAMYAVTDGFTGSFGGWNTPGTGMNFLVHNMCRLPGADGTWMVVEGGMGSVVRVLTEAGRAAGVTYETDAEVVAIDVEEGVARGVTLKDGRALRASAVVVGADPFKLPALLGDALPKSMHQRLEGLASDGSTMKLNLCLSELPTFTCLPEQRGQHRGTIHILPQENVIASIEAAFEDVRQGRLAEFPTMEWYIHTTVDPSLSDAAGRHSAALFVQWVPHTLSEGTWAEKESDYVQHLLSICDRFAPGTSDLVVDTFPLTPPKLEARFGLTRGHIHHVDNRFGFDQRMPYQTGVPGVFACSAGCHPGGSVIGAAGHNAAQALLNDG